MYDRNSNGNPKFIYLPHCPLFSEITLNTQLGFWGLKPKNPPQKMNFAGRHWIWLQTSGMQECVVFIFVVHPHLRWCFCGSAKRFSKHGFDTHLPWLCRRIRLMDVVVQPTKFFEEQSTPMQWSLQIPAWAQEREQENSQQKGVFFSAGFLGFVCVAHHGTKLENLYFTQCECLPVGNHASPRCLISPHGSRESW